VPTLNVSFPTIQSDRTLYTTLQKRIASNHQVSIVSIELELESKNMNIFVNGSFTRKNIISVTYYSISL